MGTDMNEGVTRNRGTASNPKALSSLGHRPVPIIPWLDPATAAGVVDIVQSLAADHPEAYAVILFGSVARHEERPLADSEPSDVDLLLLIDPAVLAPSASELTREQELALIHTIGEADYRQQSPREIKFIFATCRLATSCSSRTWRAMASSYGPVVRFPSRLPHLPSEGLSRPLP